MDLDFRILGPLEVASASGPVAVGPPQQRATLAVLLLHAPAPVAPDRIIDALWPEGAPPTASNLVQGYVSGLRRALRAVHGDESVIERDAVGYRLVLDPEQLDARRFESAVRSATGDARTDPASSAAILREALAMWRGPALDGLRDRPFAAEEAARLDALRTQATIERVSADLSCGRGPELVAEIDELVAQHPLDERLRGLQMVALYRAGRQADALAAFAAARDVLREELGVDPSEQLRAIETMVLQQDPSLAARPAVAGNLPAAVSSFVGRAEAVAEVERRLGGARLHTLTGAGGCGKTRLAVEAARAVAGRFPGGAWLVDLAPVSDPEDVGAIVARTLGVQVAPEADPVAAVVDFLGSQPALLVMDNCEHVITAAARAASGVLHGCPAVQVLATSREALGIAGENAWQVPSLSVPPAAATSSAEVGASEAVQLFVERAAQSAGFALTDQNAGAVASICRRLDGIPLAIELAAALTPVLSPSEIAVRLDDRFGVLSSGDPTVLPRHRTLRAAVEWSYDGLGSVERTVFLRLSVFAGSVPLAAVEAMCDDLASSELLGALRALVAKSLVVRDDSGGDSRYRMLETLRQFGQDRLDELGLRQEARDRHVRYVLGTVEAAARHARGPDSPAVMDELESMMDEVRSALDYCASLPDGRTFGRIAASLAWPWFLRGYAVEGARWLSKAIQLADPTDLDVMVELLFGASAMATITGDVDEIDRLARRNVEITRGSDHLLGKSYGWSMQATAAWIRGEYDEARQLFERSIAYSRTSGDDWGLVTDLAQVGRLHLDCGDVPAAWAVLEEARALASRRGEPMAIGLAFDQSAAAATAAGDHEAARAFAADALSNYERVDYPEGIASALNTIARIARLDGDADATENACSRALEIARKLGHRGSQATALEGLAWAAHIRGHHADAARLLGAAEAIRQEIGAPPPGSATRELAELRDAIEAELGPAYADARRAGRAVSPAELANG